MAYGRNRRDDLAGEGGGEADRRYRPDDEYAYGDEFSYDESVFYDDRGDLDEERPAPSGWPDERDGAAAPLADDVPAAPGDDGGDEFGDPPRGGVSRAVWIALAVLVAVAVAMAVYAAAIGAFGGGASPGPVATSASSASSGLLDAVSGQAVDARDKAVDGGWLSDMTVCIDPGHGAYSDLTLTPIGPGSSEMQYVEPGGAAGVSTGRGEYEVVLDVALLLRDKLEDAGVNVVMVRETNDVVMSSEERAVIANGCGADVFLRLHADGTDDPSVHGFSTLVPGENQWTEDIVEQSAYAAQVIHPVVIAETGAADRGIVERYDLAGFNFCDVPSVLFEMGYLSNPEEDVLLNDPEYQDLLATAICDGTLAYLEAASQR